MSESIEIEDFSYKKKLPFKQSANMFLHCMRRLPYLESILKDKAIKPRYNEEDVRYLDIDAHQTIAFPMICFCDIFFNRLKPHSNRYGKYAICLKKDFGLQHDIHPITYVNPDANRNLLQTRGMVQEAFTRITAEDATSTEIAHYNFILNNLLYTKPIYGYMGGKYCNFYDEREWRYVPDFGSIDDIDLQLLLTGKAVNSTTINLYSKTLANYEKTWLKIDFSDIKYLLVPNMTAANHLINFIQKNITPNEQNYLLAKIEIYSNLQGDM